MKTLEAGISVPLEAEPYEVLDLIKHLQKQLSLSGPDNAVQRLAEVEWGYLPLLEEHEGSPKTLHVWLQRNPNFFAEILSVIYRSRHEPEEEVAPPTEEQKARAQNAYRLLGSWESIPGKREDGTIDDQELMAWITTARQLCAKGGRLEVCDLQIGEILAHAPEENDGSWPCIPVRDVIDEIESDELVSGFESGIFDKRGPYSKSLGEGGTQERELARKYAAYAEACDVDWPRTAAALRRVARQYEADARREDERAQALL
jgi:hypothetical protein